MTEILYNDINQLDNLRLKYIHTYQDGDTEHVIEALVNIIEENSSDLSLDIILPSNLQNHINHMDRCKWLTSVHLSIFEALYRFADIFQIIIPDYRSYQEDLDNTHYLPSFKTIGITAIDNTIRNHPIKFTIPANWNLETLDEITKFNHGKSTPFQQCKNKIQKCIILGMCYFFLFIHNHENTDYLIIATYWLSQVNILMIQNPNLDLIKQSHAHRSGVKYPYLTLAQIALINTLAVDNANKSLTDMWIRSIIGKKIRNDGKPLSRESIMGKMVVSWYRQLEKILKSKNK